MKYLYPNPKHNKYLNQYNKIVKRYSKNEKKAKGLSLHHILPRSVYPKFKDDKRNWLFLPVKDHIKLHYLLWKYDSNYACAFWFPYTWFHKNYNYNISNRELIKLKADLGKHKRKTI